MSNTILFKLISTSFNPLIYYSLIKIKITQAFMLTYILLMISTIATYYHIFSRDMSLKSLQPETKRINT